MVDERFELQPELTGIALAYKNKSLIADEIFPSVPVTLKSFQYRVYDKGSFLSVPDTRIGEIGKPNSADLKSKLVTETCEDHALTEKIARTRSEQIQAAERGVNLLNVATMQLTDIMKLSREAALAAKLADTSNYTESTTLADDEKFSNDDVNAFKAITEALDSVLFRPNVLITSRAGFSALSQNPYVVSAVNSVDVKAGIASAEGLKRTLGVDKILIGEGLINSSRKGQKPALSYCWGNDLILLHINPIASTDYGLTYGYKATYDEVQVGTYFDPESGTKGCDVLKTFQSYIDVVTCKDCGTIIKNIA